MKTADRRPRSWGEVHSLAMAVLLVLTLPSEAFPGKTPDPPPQSRGKPPWLFSIAVKLHMKAVNGDRQAARDSRRMLEDLAATDPDNREMKAYLGSSYILAAGMALTPWVKWTYARKGLSLLDDAVDGGPKDPKIRFLRGVSTRNLPGWFGRASQSLSDISAVASNARGNFESGKLPADMAACALYMEGEARLAAGNREGAKLILKDSASLGVDNDWSRKSAVLLSKLEEDSAEEGKGRPGDADAAKGRETGP